MSHDVSTTCSLLNTAVSVYLSHETNPHLVNTTIDSFIGKVGGLLTLVENRGGGALEEEGGAGGGEQAEPVQDTDTHTEVPGCDQ